MTDEALYDFVVDQLEAIVFHGYHFARLLHVLLVGVEVDESFWGEKGVLLL